jgi:hypothetical protein
LVCASSYSGSSYLGLFDFAMFPIGCSLTGYFDFTRIYIVMPNRMFQIFLLVNMLLWSRSTLFFVRTGFSMTNYRPWLADLAVIDGLNTFLKQWELFLGLVDQDMLWLNLIFLDLLSYNLQIIHGLKFLLNLLKWNKETWVRTFIVYTANAEVLFYIVVPIVLLILISVPIYIVDIDFNFSTYGYRHCRHWF